MAYNLDVFEVFVVSIPDASRLVGVIVAVSLVAGAATGFALGAGVKTAFLLGLAFAIATFAGGEAIHRLVPGYPRNWSLYLVLISAGLAAVLLPIAVLLGGSWNLLWIALGVAFLNSFEVLVVSDGLDRFPLLGVASAVQPGGLALGLGLAVPSLARPWTAHLPAVAVLVAVGLGLGVASQFVEWLVDANVTEVDGLEITANLVQRTDLHLGLGFHTEPPVQTLAIETAGDTATLAAPWVHPGVLEGIGGGRLTRETIRRLNDGGSGFFLHVPCSHFSNAADPAVHEAVLSGVGDPETVDRASPLVTRTYDGTTFHGRRYGEDRVVYLESAQYGDYEVGVFGDVVDPARTLVVDRHVRADNRDREFVYRESAATETLRAYLDDFLDVLDEQPLYDYRAGHAVDPQLADGGISLFGLVEAVGDQRTLVLGADQNENPAPLVDVREELSEQYDEVLLFTTDTHASVYSERFDPQTTPERVRAVVKEAETAVAPAAAGLDAARGSSVDLLHSDYLRLMASLNVAARVYILLLGALYLVLVVGLLLA